MQAKQTGSSVFVEEVFVISTLMESLHPAFSYIKLLFRYTLELLFFMSVTNPKHKTIQIPLFNLRGTIQIPLTLIYIGLLIWKWFSSRSQLTSTGRILRYPLVFFLITWPSIFFPFKFYALLAHLTVAADFTPDPTVNTIWRAMVFGDLFLAFGLFFVENRFFSDLRPYSENPENILDGKFFLLSKLAFILRTTLLILSKVMGPISTGFYFFRIIAIVGTCLFEIGSFAWYRPYFNRLFEKAAGYCRILVYHFMIIAVILPGSQGTLVYVLSVWTLLASFHLFVDTKPSYQQNGFGQRRLVDIKALLSCRDQNIFQPGAIELGELKIEEDRYRSQEPNTNRESGFWKKIFTMSRLKVIIQKKRMTKTREAEGLRPTSPSSKSQKKKLISRETFQDFDPIVEDLYQKRRSRPELSKIGSLYNLEGRSKSPNLISATRKLKMESNNKANTSSKPSLASSPLLRSYEDHPRLLVKKLVYNYLKKEDSYHWMLKLLWHLKHEFHLGVVFILLNQLKSRYRTFKERLMYQVALQETKAHLNKIRERENVRIVTSERKKEGEFDLEGFSCLDYTLRPQINLARVFEYKKQMQSLTQKVLHFCDVNHEYISLLKDPIAGVDIKFNMCKNLWSINESIELVNGTVNNLVENKNGFHHLLVYYYHLFINVNRHSEAKICRKALFTKVQLTHKSLTKNEVQPCLDNLINESLVLQIESEKPRFGRILTIYGNFKMVAESAEDLVDINFTHLMTDSLVQRHSSVARRLYREDYTEFMESSVKPGFLKAVGRNIIMPGTAFVTIWPSINTDFRFLACLKADFKDPKLYISLKETPDFYVDGYSHNFLSILPEEFLINGYLQNIAPNISKRLKELRLLLKSQCPLSSRTKADNSSHKEKNQLESFFTEATSYRNILSLNDQLEPFHEVPLSALAFKDTIMFLNENEETIEMTFFISIIRKRYSNLTPADESIADGYWVLCLKHIELEDDPERYAPSRTDTLAEKGVRYQCSDKRESDNTKTDSKQSLP